MEISSITAFLGSIKTATDIAKTIKDAGASLEQAETKLKMAELISLLADAKIQAAEIQETILEKDKRITDLEKALEFKSKLIRKDGFYFNQDEQNDEPYCSRCWEVGSKAIHLNRQASVPLMNRPRVRQIHYKCPVCQNLFFLYEAIG